MTTLREAAQQALEALELYVPKEDYENKPVGNVMDALRAALAEPVQEQNDEVCDGLRGGLCIHQDPNQCNPERDCPAFSAPPKTEPQEPDSPERRCGGPGCDMRCCQPVQEVKGCAHCNHPLYAATKCRVCGRAHGIGGEE